MTSMNSHSFISSYAAPRPTCDAWCVFQLDGGADPVLLSGSGVSRVSRVQQGVFRVHFTNPDRFASGAYVSLVQPELGASAGGYGVAVANTRTDRANSELPGTTSGSCDIQVVGFNAASLTIPTFFTDTTANLKHRVNAAFFSLRSDADLYKPFTRNLLSQSFNFSLWGNANNTNPDSLQATLTDQLSPNNTKQVYEIKRNTGGFGDYIAISPTIPLVAGRTYTASVWVKAGNTAALDMGIYAGTGWGTGHISRIVSGATAVATSRNDAWGSFSNLKGNEWTRVSVTRSFTQTDTASTAVLAIYGANVNAVLGDYIYLYGAQLEDGSVATDYIEAQGTTPKLGNQDALISYSPGSRGYGRESRQNLLSRSEEFTNAYWTKVRLGISAGGYTAPNGTTTAMKLNELDQSSHKIMYTGLRGGTSGIGPFVFSIHAKALERNYLAVCDGGWGSFGNLIVDLGTGRVTQNTEKTYVDVRNCGDGWWRIAAVLRNSNYFLGDGSGMIWIGVAPYMAPTASSPDNKFGPIEQGVSGSGILVWGAQLEYGHVWGEYVKTTGTPHGTTFSRVGVTFGSEFGANNSRQATAWGTIVIPPITSNASLVRPYLENSYGVRTVEDDRSGGGSNSAFKIRFTTPMDSDAYCVILSSETEPVYPQDNPNTVGLPVPTTDEFTMLMFQGDNTTADQHRTRDSFSIRALKQVTTPGDQSFGQRSAFYQSGKTQRIHFMVFGGRTIYGTE